MSAGGRLQKRPRADHKAAAAAAAAAPGQWIRAGSYRAMYNARSTARGITRGGTKHVPGYSPFGAYEAEVRPTELGSEVWVRYVGQEATADV